MSLRFVKKTVLIKNSVNSKLRILLYDYKVLRLDNFQNFVIKGGKQFRTHLYLLKLYLSN